MTQSKSMRSALLAASSIVALGGCNDSLPTSYPEHVHNVCSAGWEKMNQTYPKQTLDEITSRVSEKQLCNCLEEKAKPYMDATAKELGDTLDGFYEAAAKYQDLKEMNAGNQVLWALLNSTMNKVWDKCVTE